MISIVAVITTSLNCDVSPFRVIDSLASGHESGSRSTLLNQRRKLSTEPASSDGGEGSIGFLEKLLIMFLVRAAVLRRGVLATGPGALAHSCVGILIMDITWCLHGLPLGGHFALLRFICQFKVSNIGTNELSSSLPGDAQVLCDLAGLHRSAPEGATGAPSTEAPFSNKNVDPKLAPQYLALYKLPSLDPGITDSRFCKQQLLLLRPLLASCTTEATMAKLRRSDDKTSLKIYRHGTSAE